jgi:hypothetical protein
MSEVRSVPKPQEIFVRYAGGQVVGHIVSAEGVRIDPSRVEAIQTLSLPRSRKEVQAFLGKIDFLRKFVSNFVEIVKHITAMLRKGNEVKWTAEPRAYFDQIKMALTKTPMLISPNYSKEFLIFSFASFDTIAAVLLQKIEKGHEQPIAFFNRALRDAETKYEIMEKKAYALVKALKSFRIYVLHSKVTTYVPSASVKDILVQPDIDGRRGKWIEKILEFDLEINPTKLVKGQGLAKLLVESNCEALGVNFLNTRLGTQQAELPSQGSQDGLLLADCAWYRDILYFL